MKNIKFFIISALVVLLFGVCVFCVSYINSKTQKYEMVNITTATTESITILDEPQKNFKGSGFCVGNSRNITTEMQDDRVVAKYEEYIFKCLCKGKLLDDFTFKSSNSIAGEICDNQCAELCQKAK